MPATPLPVNGVTITGVAPVGEVAADVTNGNQLASNNGVSTWVEATNTGGSSYTLTLVTTATYAGRAVADDVITLAASAKRRIGPFPLDLYGPNPLLQAQNAAITLAAYSI